MERLQVNLAERSYPILISPQSWQSPELVETIRGKRCVVVTNPTVAALYLTSLLRQLPSNTLVYQVADGERFKTLDSFSDINGFLLENHCGRDSMVIALGGGVVGDLAGFVAACYQRGVPFIQVPTTLLSQVDSSVGGKTAVNHPLGKNMIGAFKQPDLVLIDPTTLISLPEREFSAGLAEVLKYGLLFDWTFVEWLEHHKDSIWQRDASLLTQVIRRCCQFKADVVARDETETGERALLNLGHTFGHAIEAELGYGVWLHGEAVAAGMMMALQLSEVKGWIAQNMVLRVQQLLQSWQLPVWGPDSMSASNYLPHMRKDKKNQSGQIRLILPTGLGICQLVDNISDQELIELIDHH